MRHLLCCSLLLALAACGGSSPEAEAPATPAAAPAEAAPAEAAPAAEEAVPEPMPHADLNVGVTRTVLVFAESKDLESERFKADLMAAEAKEWPVAAIWLGCMEGVMKAMGGSHERWVATLSFQSEADAKAFADANGITPLIIVEDTIDPCGD